MDQKDDEYLKAAKLILSSQIMFVHTGAGMSADSGLPVYNDVAKFEAYKAKRLNYIRVCNPTMLEEDAEIFYGFWGSCFNGYRTKKPHQGYEILKKWKREFFHPDSAVGKYIKEKLQNYEYDDIKEDQQTLEPKQSNENSNQIVNHPASNFLTYRRCPGPFFAVTSNVDCHFLYSGLVSITELSEIHGHIETWQCSEDCEGKTWSAPSDFFFEVDDVTMRAPKNQFPPEKLTKEMKEAGFTSNHPICPTCGRPSRPAILMFGDEHWVGGWSSKRRPTFHQFEDICGKWLNENKNQKMVVLEIGCGENISTMRNKSHNVLREIPQAVLIRINPVESYCDVEEIKDRVISIQDTGLSALFKIDEIIERLKKECQEISSGIENLNL